MDGIPDEVMTFSSAPHSGVKSKLNDHFSPMCQHRKQFVNTRNLAYPDRYRYAKEFGVNPWFDKYRKSEYAKKAVLVFTGTAFFETLDVWFVKAS